jgi:glucose-6-phosphate isomerase
MASRSAAITKHSPAKPRAWKALEAHYKKIRGLHLRQLFADDSKRGERLTGEAVGLFLRLLEEPYHGSDAQTVDPS